MHLCGVCDGVEEGRRAEKFDRRVVSECTAVCCFFKAKLVRSDSLRDVGIGEYL